MLQELGAIMQALLQRINQRVEREAQTLDQLALRLSHALPNPDRMREQMTSLQQRIHQAWSVRMENWQRNQSHYQSQLELLNPQRTLERGYAVVLKKEKEDFRAIRDPRELTLNAAYQVCLADGQAEIELSKIVNKQ
jgi:exodeoxyribonuclease VII large subunit